MELNNSHLNNKSFFYKYLYSVLLFAINHIIYFWKMEIIFFFVDIIDTKWIHAFVLTVAKKAKIDLLC